ncbi:Rrf2 family transcriptional regulator [Paenibacillus sp. HWE-109]|uniref:RrF2 family transcriptional regulator n=1 Tax=Paenibacillus sp. HWE-109 TaxID=1306526 RepID=UPI001EDD3304|nr:Rrf2 family transcriptional regulator [Paenibacillus sp. HWE-109]UKS29365.1 Rrf2 family transcriptional regulator [Paenibacillus sp. HWE-109]
MKKSKQSPPSNNKAFGLALQALAVMSMNPNRFASSNIANHLCSEASLMRRIMAKLAHEQILEVREGRDGGYWIKKPPESITFADVYTALQVGESLCSGLLDSTGDHPLGLQMNDVFADMAEELQQGILDVLRKRTIADLANEAIIKSN